MSVYWWSLTPFLNSNYVFYGQPDIRYRSNFDFSIEIDIDKEFMNKQSES